MRGRGFDRNKLSDQLLHAWLLLNNISRFNLIFIICVPPIHSIFSLNQKKEVLTLVSFLLSLNQKKEVFTFISFLLSLNQKKEVLTLVSFLLSLNQKKEF